MNVVCQEQDNIVKIIVQGLEKKKDIESLLSFLDTSKDIQISFLNIQAIPIEVILVLKKIESRLKIDTNETTLKNYLMKLGFKLSYYDNYKKENRKVLDLQYMAIGGSSGSLEKIINIIQNLPKSQMSIFIIMHQKPDVSNHLPQILQRCTKYYKVCAASSDTKVQPATIYVAPPNKHMVVTGDFIFLLDTDKRNFSRPSLSTSYESLSNEYTNRLLVVTVCGYGSDGSDSLELLQKNNSTVIVEDPQQCEAKLMLESAIKTKNYDYIKTVEEINEFIKDSLDTSFFTNTQLKEFLKKVDKKYGYDYTNYNQSHIKRRVHLFYNNLNAKSFKEFEDIILSNKTVFKDLFLNISVNITTFYRNPEVFKLLKEELLPKLDSFLDIKIWCAGCSSGEEPYSLAIFLEELGLLNRSLIYATDLNDIILKEAQNGLYPKESYNLFLKHYYKAGGSESFSKYFEDHSEFVQVKDRIKEKILFFKHNLVVDGKINDFQLIFCRNVIIYFDNELKAHVFDLFNKSLDTYGFLVLGESESLNTHEKYITIDEKNKIYKRKI